MTQVTQNEDVQQTCDLCGSSSFETISKYDRHNKPLKTGICQGCGLVMHQPMPSEDEISAYYAKDYRRDYHGESKPSPRRIMRAWNNGQRILKQIKSFIPEKSNVFEVGAGIGCTVKSFEVDGFDASGIEPNTDFNSYTRDVLHASVENINLYDLKADYSRDVLLLIHVIEHFVSPKRALTHMRGLIKDDGLLYIECPNVGAPFATFGRLFHFAHTYNFTHNTLINMAKVAGFEVVQAFTDTTNPDIQILFKKVTIPESVEFDKQEAKRSHDAIFRYNWLTYNLRADYLLRRIIKLTSYAKEYMQANSFVKELEGRFKS
ncbi:MAG: class I SAM-dependent methyltransferase [Mariprofundaceae bacterium]|nr:class I SAM-dependent methyltransferase [Mariprofundaceae bacterium]